MRQVRLNVYFQSIHCSYFRTFLAMVLQVLTLMVPSFHYSSSSNLIDSFPATAHSHELPITIRHNHISSPSLHVVKTYRQVNETHIGYWAAANAVVAVDRSLDNFQSLPLLLLPLLLVRVHSEHCAIVRRVFFVQFGFS